ncbi:glycogen debranching N-terminal domain-containing protein [Micromonospora sp. NPDC005206]|uniref:amylo-alpha-1,6-glucosidase n=1 Tax=Micromonospora sp. NPDC005206 TaxID=3157022 RepID=UPI0033B11620
MRLDQINILQGDAFVVSDRQGDINPAANFPDGLFYRDMRHLSRWQLRLNGHQLEALSADNLEYDEVVFFLIEPTGTIYRNPSLSVTRRRAVATGMQERITVHNFGNTPVAFELTMIFDADFADIFDVKDQMSKTGHLYRHRRDGGITLGYSRADFCRETHIDAPGAFVTEESLTFRHELPPAQEWDVDINIRVGVEVDVALERHHRCPDMPCTIREWLDASPILDTDWDDLLHIYHRSLLDLAALRFYPFPGDKASLPAAGLPWFMAVFGRDSLLVSYQMLPFHPELAYTTLRALAERQAIHEDDHRDAEPGKILHELRNGERAHFGERPQSPYFGAADTTPLFLIVLDEYERWTGDTQTVQDLEPAARAALRWLETYGDPDGDGYIEYQTRNPGSGLVNQCWKDSWNSVVHPDGSLAKLPRATCEIQGYAYDARRRTARLAREIWNDPGLAERLERDAEELYRRFNTDFWLPDLGYYALALDGDKKPVTTLTSNIGHLLWSGIVPPERVDALAALLCGPRMFTGWGVRTLADGQPAYNPLEYHNGTVWPHDTAIAAAGLARYGHRDEANQLAMGLLQAGHHLGHRLPEALAGYPRKNTLVPVLYPTACSPQAWAAGAPMMLLRMMLGIDPEPDTLAVRPHLPEDLRRLALHGVRFRGTRVEALAGTAAHDLDRLKPIPGARELQ